MHFNLNRHTVRSSRWTIPVNMLLLVALVAATVLPLPGQAQDGTTAIAGVQPVLYLLAPSASGAPPMLSPGLTLHARLQTPNGAGWVVSGTPEQAIALGAAGGELVVLDADTTGNRYYLVDASVAPSRPPGRNSRGRTLYRQRCTLDRHHAGSESNC